jgi:hypothetical protein
MTVLHYDMTLFGGCIFLLVLLYPNQMAYMYSLFITSF